jgi:enoyl-CoA hydratase
MVTTDSAEVLFEVRNALGIITLNRPRQLNALNYGMVKAMHEMLQLWARNPALKAVAITGAGEKAFCAGGDIRSLHDMGKAGRIEEARMFWREEYTLNRFIKRYPKPYVAFVDGIVMGGGVGVSVHGSHVVAGEKYLFAMPEVGIGFFPDVGATYALSRLPDHLGRYLTVTGARIGADDGMAAGLVTHRIASSNFAQIMDALSEGADVDAVLNAHAAVPQPAPLGANRATIRAAFDHGTVVDILAALDTMAARGDGFAAQTAEAMRTKSPTSMVLALEQMVQGANLSFEDAMTLEFRIVSRIVAGHDFIEGVRAVIIDKDQKPRWNPVRIEDVSDEIIAPYLAPLVDDLVFDGAA